MFNHFRLYLPAHYFNRTIYGSGLHAADACGVRQQLLEEFEGPYRIS